VIQYGTVVAVIALGLLVTETGWGVLAKRIATRGWILGLGIAVALILLAVGLSYSIVTFALSLSVLGAMSIFPVPLLRWLAMTAGGPGTGGSGTGQYSVFTGIGLVAGSALGPALFGVIGYFWLSVVAAGLWIGGISVLAILPWARLDVPVRHTSVLRQIRHILMPHFAVVAALVALFLVCYALPSNFLQYYSVDIFGGSPADSGYVIGAMRATSLAAGLLLGRVVDRWGPPRSAPFGFLVIIAGTVGTLGSHSYAEMIAFTLVFAVGVGWLNADLLPLALDSVSRDLQGTAVGLFGSFEDVGLLIGPILIGGVYSAFGASTMFIIIAAVAGAGMVGAAALASLTRQAPDP
jgi:predicted MFS family arabinose efflux permease